MTEAGVPLPDLALSCVRVVCPDWSQCPYFWVVLLDSKFVWQLGEDRRLIHISDFNGDCWNAPGATRFKIAEVDCRVCCLDVKPVFCYFFKVQGLENRQKQDLFLWRWRSKVCIGLAMQAEALCSRSCLEILPTCILGSWESISKQFCCWGSWWEMTSTSLFFPWTEIRKGIRQWKEGQKLGE